jgi:hypothetical protein
MKLWKTRQAKICFTVVCIIAVLAAAFILQPGPKKAVGNTTDSLNTSDSSGESSSVSNLQTPTVSSTSGKDKYETDSVPKGKPKPVEPEDVTIDNGKKHTVTLSICCDTILDNMGMFNKDKLGVLPEKGVILAPMTVTFSEGENVFDVLKRVTREERIHMEFKFTPIYNSAYIQGIHNLYEFDCGGLSGWMYKVNDWFPNYGASRYVLQQGDVIEWVYTCDLGRDVGGGYAIGGQIVG